jgi:hypothetical protein
MTRKAHYDHAALAKTLDDQLSVISRTQALASGLTIGALRHRTRPGGPWRILLPGVYLAEARVPGVPQREIAATLYAGDGSMITGVAALWRHEIRHPVSDLVDVLVPAARKVQSTGFARVWRTTRRTLRRHAEMSAHGIIVLHFTPGQIRREPERVLAAIRKALASAAGRAALDIRTVPAS